MIQAFSGLLLFSPSLLASKVLNNLPASLCRLSPCILGPSHKDPLSVPQTPHALSDPPTPSPGPVLLHHIPCEPLTKLSTHSAVPALPQEGHCHPHALLCRETGSESTARGEAGVAGLMPLSGWPEAWWGEEPSPYQPRWCGDAWGSPPCFPETPSGAHRLWSKL